MRHLGIYNAAVPHHCTPLMPREMIVSPRGEALWAKLFEAQGFEDGPRAYSISLLLDPNDPSTIEFTEKLDLMFEELHGSKCKVAKHGRPYRMQTTTQDGKEIETGLVEIRFKRKEMSNKGNPMDPPVVVDAKKNRWPKEKAIGNGSKIKVAFEYFGWEMAGAKGMSLDLAMVQVIELVEYARDVDPFDEEDGYELPAEAETPFTDALREPEAEPTGFAAQLRARAAQVQAEAAEVEASEIPF